MRMSRLGAMVALCLFMPACRASPAIGDARPVDPAPIGITSVNAPEVPVAASAAARPPLPRERLTLRAEGGHGVEVYPPLAANGAEAPLVVFLHATCMQPKDVCDFWSEGARDASFLVCPAGPSRCYGEPDWSGTPEVKATTLAAALTTVDREFGTWIDHARGDVLIGYSRGAFAARDILYHDGRSRFRGLILLSAAVSPDPAKLTASGIRRVVMATGDLDGSRSTMLQATKKLASAGIPTRFVTLGRIGHWLPDNLEDILREAVAWVATS